MVRRSIARRSDLLLRRLGGKATADAVDVEQEGSGQRTSTELTPDEAWEFTSARAFAVKALSAGNESCPQSPNVGT